jgi:hypothetical protein
MVCPFAEALGALKRKEGYRSEPESGDKLKKYGKALGVDQTLWESSKD